jgi:hypothetical protein
MASPVTRNWTRARTDDCHINDDTRIATGPGRYVLEAPSGYANATFTPEPTTRLQKWGDAQINAYGKTDVESDLWNINRNTTKEVCGQYDPNDNRMNKAEKKQAKESSFPQTHARLNDPPCTLRGSGWNRFQWLCQNPQENVMMPFDWFIPGRIVHKDAHRPCIPTPMSPEPVIPAPQHLGHNVVDVPGAYGVTIKDATSLSVGAIPAQVLPQNAFRDVSPAGIPMDNEKQSYLLDTREVAWPEAPSLDAVPYPVPTGPPSIAWQRNDYAQGIYNTNSIPTTNITGRVLPGPALKTSN